MELVEPRELPTDLVENIRRFRFQGTSAKVNFALDAPPKYPALGDRTDQYRGFTNIGPSMEYLERAFDDAKYGWYSKRPYIDTAIQSEVDPDMAPPGKAVMSCFIQYAPYHLRESDWDTEKEHLGDTVQATLESFFPGFGDLVLQREVRTPLDIERTVGLSEGNIFAGEFLAPQMFFFRPAPGWSQYRTPIDGYYQCGSGTHPGRLRDGRAGQAGGRPDPQGSARAPEGAPDRRSCPGTIARRRDERAMDLALTPEQAGAARPRATLRGRCPSAARGRARARRRRVCRRGQARELRRAGIAAGLAGGAFPQALGGQGWSVVEQVLVHEQYGQVTGGLWTFVPDAYNVLVHGDAEQRRRYLDPSLRGERSGSYAITEPERRIGRPEPSRRPPSATRRPASGSSTARSGS